jgi:hypothetical protein
MAIKHIPQITSDLTTTDTYVEWEFGIADTWIIDLYVPGEWNGSSSKLVKFYSDTPASQTTIDLSTIGNVSVSYIDFKDIAFVNGTVYADSTCTGINQNNSGIVWGAVTSTDASTISESLSAQFDAISSLDDTSTLSENLSAQGAGVLNESDTSSLSESLSAQFDAISSLADTSTISESLAAVSGAISSQADTSALSEILAGTFAAICDQSDTASISESLDASFAAQLATQSDTSTTSENLSAVFDAVSSQADVASVSEALNGTFSTTCSMGDTAVISDSMDAQYSQGYATLSDTLTVYESLTAQSDSSPSQLSEIYLQRKLYDWIGTILNLWSGQSIRAINEIAFVWHMQNMPRYKIPLLMGRISAVQRIGRDVPFMPDNSGSRRGAGIREFMLYLQFFGAGAIDALEKLVDATDMPEMIASLQANGITPVECQDVLDAHVFLDTMPEERAMLDIRFRTTSEWSSTIDAIESAQITGEINELDNVTINA